MEGEIVDNIQFKCDKCKKYFTLPEPGPVKINTQPLPFKREYWFRGGPDICEDCDPTSRKNKRSKALDLILEEKKWWQIF